MMRDMSSSTWLRRGSSIVFDRATIGQLIGKGNLISLKEALSWMNAWPDAPSGNSQTVLVCGVETILEIMEPEEVQDFLKRRIKPFVQEFQTNWDQRGLVFGFGTHEKSFKLTASEEEVLFIRRDGGQVRLSYSLWDGSSTMNMSRLVRNEQGESITVGFYVARIS